ncbi:hypothetical protein P2318_01370 [Myxococcaceae bacterium GXIMD 01537]
MALAPAVLPLVPLVALALVLGPALAAAQDAAPAEPPVQAPLETDVPRLPPVSPGLSDGGAPALSLLAQPAPVPAGEASRPSFEVLPVVVSVVPGLLFHGLGPLAAGDTTTAKRLFAMEGLGLGLVAAGLVPIALTGASRRTIGPLYAVTLAGAGLFSVSALANIYSVVSPAFTPGVVPPSLPPLELELGYQYVNDPHFDFHNFVSLGAVARLDKLQLDGMARISPDDGNTRVRLGGAWRLLGAPEARLAGSDGSALDAEAGAYFHRYPTEDFTLAGGEVGLRGRYAMSRLSPRLAGSFAEMSAGVYFYGYGFPSGISDDALNQGLLFSFGYGVWLGRGGPLRGEALLYYSHRKDDFAGGLVALGDIPGHFGLRGRVLLTERWGVAAELQAGSAYVARLSLVYAVGGEP